MSGACSTHCKRMATVLLKSGRYACDECFDEWADEAERGYDLKALKPHGGWAIGFYEDGTPRGYNLMAADEYRKRYYLMPTHKFEPGDRIRYQGMAGTEAMVVAVFPRFGRVDFVWGKTAFGEKVAYTGNSDDWDKVEPPKFEVGKTYRRLAGHLPRRMGTVVAVNEGGWAIGFYDDGTPFQVHNSSLQDGNYEEVFE